MSPLQLLRPAPERRYDLRRVVLIAILALITATSVSSPFRKSSGKRDSRGNPAAQQLITVDAVGAVSVGATR
jgi:hypothetical protein